MAQASHSDSVRAHLTGKSADGAVFEKSIGDRPAQFIIGDGGSRGANRHQAEEDLTVDIRLVEIVA